MLKEFKAFIAKGNVLDLAVGVIVGGAFGKIVTSLVNNVLMPFAGILLGGVSFESLSVTVGKATIEYGLFIQSIVDFLIISLSIFLLIKAIRHMKRKKEKEQPEPVKPSKEELLLTEIRDLLKEQSTK